MEKNTSLKPLKADNQKKKAAKDIDEIKNFALELCCCAELRLH